MNYTNVYQKAAHQRFLRYGGRLNHLDFWDTITKNVGEGLDNLKLAASGHPIDALTKSALSNAASGMTNQDGTPLSIDQQNALLKKVTVAEVEKRVADKIKKTVNTTFDLFGSVKWILIAVIVILLISKFK